VTVQPSRECEDPHHWPSAAVSSCPACGSLTADVVGAPGSAWDTVVADCVFRHPEYQVKHCGECGLYFKTAVLSEAALHAYYAVLPFESFESTQLFPTDRLMLACIGKVDPGAKILDFGCGVGRLLQRLVSRHRCFGVEVNQRACQVARAAGISIVSESDVRCGSAGDFDVVIVSDVFEHLPSPLQFLTPLVSALKAGGALIVSTGNGDAIRFRDCLSHFWYFRVPGHLQMLSPRHLQWTAQQLGLAVEECHITSHYDTPLPERARQHLKSFAFEQFHSQPAGRLAPFLRLLPGLRRAERWPMAPALTCTDDHLVAVLRKQ
jgi:2-polyprenyl-3-methyl-5-hydroxy-6-metoxy-1,4-benzoquinol methylase